MAVSKKLKGGRLKYNVSDAKYYKKEIMALVKSMVRVVNREIEKVVTTPAATEYFAQDANVASQARIVLNKLTREFDRIFTKKSAVLATRMVKRSKKSSRTALNASLTKISDELTISTNVITGELKTALKSAVSENVALIKSIGQEYLSKVERSVLFSITHGQGFPTIKKQLLKLGGMTERRAKNIALDQTRKTYNLINDSRMKKLGLNRFTWYHSGGGQKPRKDHIAMNGKTYSLNFPPVIDKKTGERGIPGQAPNCGCTMGPVFSFEDLSK